MKFPFSALSLLFLIFSFPLLAQTTKQTDEKPLFVYVSVEQPASFPGGQDSLLKYISRNVLYPVEAIKNGEQGISFISFVIDSLGQVLNPEVLKSATPSLDAEAIRIVNNMPRWNPGKHKGRPVAVGFNLPVRFQLNQDKIKEDPKLNHNSPPQFQGGEEALMQFLGKNLRNPKRKKGLVPLKFTVDSTGVIRNIKVLESTKEKPAHESLVAEAIRIVEMMPLWIPGEKNGRAVDMDFTFPIRFSIN